MTTKPITDIKIVDGKVVRKIGFRAGAKKRKADREAAAWQKKSPRSKPRADT